MGSGFFHLERAWQALEAALMEQRRLGLRDTVERAWHALGGPATVESERELDGAEAFFEALADLEAREAGPVDLERLGRALESLYAPSRERPDVRVELLTVHKAKGLQSDTVIVTALERTPGRDPQRLLHWLKLPVAGRNELVVAPVARTRTDPPRHGIGGSNARVVSLPATSTQSGSTMAASRPASMAAPASGAGVLPASWAPASRGGPASKRPPASERPPPPTVDEPQAAAPRRKRLAQWSN